ncbi:MAG: transcription elongation factor GreA [Bacteroidetes bacterium]|nr:transcription elongation factor GreA [Bacteroidota bacterium]
MKSEIIYLTRSRLVELENELRELKTNARKRMAEKIAEARSHGDLSENAEYDAAKEEQGHLEMKISKLEEMLSRAKIVVPEELAEGEVTILSSVKVKDKSINEVITYVLVSPEEADFELDKISVTSPVGRSLMGKKVGDKFEVEVPVGKVKYEILEIQKPV